MPAVSSCQCHHTRIMTFGLGRSPASHPAGHSVQSASCLRSRLSAVVSAWRWVHPLRDTASGRDHGVATGDLHGCSPFRARFDLRSGRAAAPRTVRMNSSNSSGVCRLCASPKLARHLEVRGSTLDHCEDCGFVQVRERPSIEQLQELYKDSYFAKSKYDRETAQRRENRRRLSLLEQAGVPRGGRVLDVGCATGAFIGVAGSVYDMWGVDVSPYAVERARACSTRFAQQISAGLIEDVLEHFWEPRSTLELLVRSAARRLAAPVHTGHRRDRRSFDESVLGIHDPAGAPRILQSGIPSVLARGGTRAPDHDIASQRQVDERRVCRVQAGPRVSQDDTTAMGRHVAARADRAHRALRPDRALDLIERVSVRRSAS
jgi:SAM-dependent methyltransferase